MVGIRNTNLATSACVTFLFAAPGGLLLNAGSQGPTLVAPAFEVASIKPNKSGVAVMSMGFRPGSGFFAANGSLRELVALAYGMPRPLRAFQMVGGPNWMTGDRFDIQAKAEAGTAPGNERQMLRALLADRFNLVVHNDVRQLPIYTLVTRLAEGKLGPQLRRATIDCAARRGTRGSGLALPPPPGDRQDCGLGGTPGSLWGGGVTMTALADALSARVNRVVVDMTALRGNFDLDLTWTPDQLAAASSSFSEPPSPTDQSGPSIFTAVQEQLGLKLESTIGPVDVLVIDSAERPTPD